MSQSNRGSSTCCFIYLFSCFSVVSLEITSCSLHITECGEMLYPFLIHRYFSRSFWLEIYQFSWFFFFKKTQSLLLIVPWRCMFALPFVSACVLCNFIPSPLSSCFSYQSWSLSPLTVPHSLQYSHVRGLAFTLNSALPTTWLIYCFPFRWA